MNIRKVIKTIDVHFPHRLRSTFRKGAEDAAESIIALAKGECDASPAVQVRAFDSLNKYGLGKSHAISLEQGEWLGQVAEVTARYLPDEETYDQWCQEIMNLLNSNR